MTARVKELRTDIYLKINTDLWDKVDAASGFLRIDKRVIVTQALEKWLENLDWSKINANTTALKNQLKK